MGRKMEQRKQTRVKTHIPVKYHRLRDGSGADGIGSISRNLSKGGVRFRTSEFISMACRLILELDIPQITKPIKIISRVAWIRKTDSGDDYEIGNQFLEISKEDKDIVSEYVDNLDVHDDSEISNRQTEFTAKA